MITLCTVILLHQLRSGAPALRLAVLSLLAAAFCAAVVTLTLNGLCRYSCAVYDCAAAMLTIAAALLR